MRLEGRVALVTGGASGIGAATCRRLAAEGARVAVTDVQVAPARAVAQEIGGLALELDVTSRPSAEAAVASAEQELGPLDVLVNNAGLFDVGWFALSDEQSWDRSIAVNLKGVLLGTRLVLPGMQQRGHGTIVNVASEAGRVGSPGSAVYSAAKAAVIAFTRAIAKEAARYGVTCNAVAPGPVETPMLEATRPVLQNRVIDSMVEKTMLRRLGHPDEIAAAIAFLASDDASYITGETLGVSGGLG